MGKLGASGIGLNRKMLAEIAISDPVAFQQIASA
jgi:ribosomal protein L20